MAGPSPGTGGDFLSSGPGIREAGPAAPPPQADPGGGTVQGPGPAAGPAQTRSFPNGGGKFPHSGPEVGGDFPRSGPETGRFPALRPSTDPGGFLRGTSEAQGAFRCARLSARKGARDRRDPGFHITSGGREGRYSAEDPTEAIGSGSTGNDGNGPRRTGVWRRRGMASTSGASGGPAAAGTAGMRRQIPRRPSAAAAPATTATDLGVHHRRREGVWRRRRGASGTARRPQDPRRHLRLRRPLRHGP